MKKSLHPLRNSKKMVGFISTSGLTLLNDIKDCNKKLKQKKDAEIEEEDKTSKLEYTKYFDEYFPISKEDLKKNEFKHQYRVEIHRAMAKNDAFEVFKVNIHLNSLFFIEIWEINSWKNWKEDRGLRQIFMMESIIWYKK